MKPKDKCCPVATSPPVSISLALSVSYVDECLGLSLLRKLLGAKQRLQPGGPFLVCPASRRKWLRRHCFGSAPMPTVSDSEANVLEETELEFDNYCKNILASSCACALVLCGYSAGLRADVER